MTYFASGYGKAQNSICGGCATQHVKILNEEASCGCTCHLASYTSIKIPRIFETDSKSYILKETSDFADKAKAYFSGEGKRLDDYLEGQGRKAYELVGVGTTDLGGSIAAILINGDKARIAGNYGFEDHVKQLARQYDAKQEWVERYVLDHENTHRWQQGMHQTEHEAEQDVEDTLISYYNHLRRLDPDNKPMYEALGRIAGDRSQNVARNYATPALESIAA